MSLLDLENLKVVKYTDECTEGSDMEAIPEEQQSVTTIEVTTALIPDIPPLKFHDGPLQFLSKPQTTQQEYGRRILSREQDPHRGPLDEELTIRCCPDGVEPKIFKITRSNLARSPAFQKFFESRHFAPNCDFLISFLNDSADVFDIVKRYLEQGPELFDATILKVYILRRYTTIDRIIILVRLCRMAHNMGLWYLHEMAYNVLVDGNRFVDASILPTLASLIFAKRANYHQNLKDWCYSHASHHFLELKDSADWAGCLVVCEDLRQEWHKMVEQNMEVLTTMEDVSDDGVLEDMIHRMSFQERDRAISVLGEQQARVEATSTQDPRKRGESAKKKVNPDGSDSEEWEDIGTIPSEEGGLCQLSAAASTGLLGISGSSARSNNAETAKARQVMGIDEPDGKGLGKKKRKGGRSRIMFMLH